MVLSNLTNPVSHIPLVLGELVHAEDAWRPYSSCGPPVVLNFVKLCETPSVGNFPVSHLTEKSSSAFIRLPRIARGRCDDVLYFL